MRRAVSVRVSEGMIGIFFSLLVETVSGLFEFLRILRELFCIL